MLPITTAEIKPSYEVLGMEEAEYHNYLDGLHIGRKFLREREELVRSLNQLVESPMTCWTPVVRASMLIRMLHRYLLRKYGFS